MLTRKDLVVLIADDEPENLQFCERVLRGYNTVTATRGDEAAVILAEHRIDIVLTDERMPGLTGTALLKKARTTNPFIRRIVLSAYADPDTLLAAINNGQVERYLVKPVAADELRQVVDALADEYIQTLQKQEHVAEMEERLSHLSFVERRVDEDRRRRVRRDTDEVISSIGDAWQRLEREVSRAQRYDHSLSLLVLNSRPGIHRAMQERLRTADEILILGEHLVCVLPQTTRAQATALMRRLANDVLQDAQPRVASYPEDGTGVGALLAVAR